MVWDRDSDTDGIGFTLAKMESTNAIWNNKDIEYINEQQRGDLQKLRRKWTDASVVYVCDILVQDWIGLQQT